MAEYRLTPRAEQDLEQIWRYTVEQWSTAQAEKYVGSLLDAMEALAKNPKRGRSAAAIRSDYWRRNCGAHIIFYQIAKDGIAVIRILHQQMEIEARLEEE